ncbi:tetratricopeptide repeat protein [Methylomarinum sp. Ch1-1]|uniref:Tetratricopeptide repeat protein n=1 Tax=Methylomarinum roseum TaxID=3067653 RepID=A0AAU7NPI9_9GAMM|nr:tetratricopeptide repeat protein [Methylomarinum sp. Ch1-1]MDP4521214.1 tetratricopeptide repeat protein [Methylomarinum sp. Ch1-1]
MMKKFKDTLLNCVFFTFLMFITFPAFAVRYYGDITEAELRTLPPFCTSWAKKDRELLARHQKRYDFRNPQHLCPGLNALNNAQKMFNDKRAQGYALSVAVSELSYVLEAKNNQFALRPTVLRYRGRAYEMQGNLSKAIADYEEAIRLKSNYTQAHIGLIDIYLKMGNKKEARKRLEQALEKKPNSKLLLKKKRQIKSMSQ